MKTATLAVGAILTALAPAAFAQYSSGAGDARNWDEPRSDSRRFEERRYDDGRYEARRYDDRYYRDSPQYGESYARQECWNPRAGHFEEMRGPRGAQDDLDYNRCRALGSGYNRNYYGGR